MVNLQDVEAQPEKRWIHLKENQSGMLVLVDDGKKATMSLLLTWCSNDEFQELVSASVGRKVAGRRGQKEVDLNPGRFHEALADQHLHDWKLTYRSLKALQAQVDFSKVDDLDQAIPYSEQNLRWLLTKSRFGAELQDLCTDYELWIGAPEAEVEAAQEGNSGSGPSTNTAD